MQSGGGGRAGGGGVVAVWQKGGIKNRWLVDGWLAAFLHFFGSCIRTRLEH